MAFSSVESAIRHGDSITLEAIGNLLGSDVKSETNKLLAVFSNATQEHKLILEGIAEKQGYSDGLLYSLFQMAVANGVAPLIIFMGVGALTDFGPLIANPKVLLLGAAAQLGIFSTLLGVLLLNDVGWVPFSLADAAAIGIIGGADGPTAIYVAGRLAPDLLGAIAVAAYSYMALVPLIQPPIMRALTTQRERRIVMKQLRPVRKLEKMIFPLVLFVMTSLLLPAAAPLLGMFCLGNLMRESDRHSTERVNEYHHNFFGFGCRVKIGG
jgi:carboxybiotin decarboxylase